VTVSGKLKLGKGIAFVKSHLRRLPLCEEVWEADFLWGIRSGGRHDPIWHGLVVAGDGRILAQRTVEIPPTVNDMADLLAHAMQRPHDEMPRRPRTLRIRKRQEWQALLPHLEQLVDRVVSAPRIAQWDKVFKEFSLKEARFGSASPNLGIDDVFPATAEWVRTSGWIEIGNQAGIGRTVRALDSGGLVFENRKAKTLAQALSALEKGLAKHRAGVSLRENGTLQ
jgi:hypothetical protein